MLFYTRNMVDKHRLKKKIIKSVTKLVINAEWNTVLKNKK